MLLKTLVPPALITMWLPPVLLVRCRLLRSPMVLTSIRGPATTQLWIVLLKVVPLSLATVVGLNVVVVLVARARVVSGRVVAVTSVVMASRDATTCFPVRCVRERFRTVVSLIFGCCFVGYVRASGPIFVVVVGYKWLMI